MSVRWLPVAFRKLKHETSFFCLFSFSLFFFSLLPFPQRHSFRLALAFFSIRSCRCGTSCECLEIRSNASIRWCVPLYLDDVCADVGLLHFGWETTNDAWRPVTDWMAEEIIINALLRHRTKRIDTRSKDEINPVRAGTYSCANNYTNNHWLFHFA